MKKHFFRTSCPWCAPLKVEYGKDVTLTLPSPAKRARVKISSFGRKIPSPIPMGEG